MKPLFTKTGKCSMDKLFTVALTTAIKGDGNQDFQHLQKFEKFLIGDKFE